MATCDNCGKTAYSSPSPSVQGMGEILQAGQIEKTGYCFECEPKLNKKQSSFEAKITAKNEVSPTILVATLKTFIAEYPQKGEGRPSEGKITVEEKSLVALVDAVINFLGDALK